MSNPKMDVNTALASLLASGFGSDGRNVRSGAKSTAVMKRSRLFDLVGAKCGLGLSRATGSGSCPAEQCEIPPQRLD
jgi:hypothetical protein